jgi:hypothetical protein
MGLADGGHAIALRRAQLMWDADRCDEAIATLEAVRPGLMPEMFSTDAHILATLATFVMEGGDPKRALDLLQGVPIDERPKTDVQAYCLGARCRCRAATGDLSGAQSDRLALFKAKPTHEALLHADDAIRNAKRSLLERATISRPQRTID